MVLKRSKLGRNTGNSFKTFCQRHQTHRHGCIAKFLLNKSISRTENPNVTDETRYYFPDGGLTSNQSPQRELCLVYSLNKHKRWTLQDLIPNICYAGYLDDEDYVILVLERSLPRLPPFRPLDGTCCKMTVLDTVSIFDSLNGYNYARSTFSSLTDLSFNKVIDNSHIRSKDRVYYQRFCNLKGVQRKYNRLGIKRSDQRYIGSTSEDEPVEDAPPEIRYELWYNHPKLKCNEVLYPGYHEGDQPIKAYHKQSKLCGKTPLVWKMKGRKNKKWARCKFKGIDPKEEKGYYNGLFKTEHVFATDIVQREHEEDRNQRFLEIVFHDPDNDDYSPYIFDRDGDNALVLGDFIKGQTGYRREKLVKVSKFKSQNAKSLSTKTAETSGNQWNFITSQPSEYGNSVCDVDMQSVKEFLTGHRFKCKVSKRCRPRRYAVSLEAGDVFADLVFWPRGNFQSDGNSSAIQCWVRIHLYTQASEDAENTECLLSAALSSTDPHVFTLQEITSIAQNIINQLQQSSTARSVPWAFSGDICPKDDMLDLTDILNEISWDESKRTGGHYCNLCSCGLPDPHAQGVLLLPCQHFFCNDCLKSHIIQGIYNGLLNITCPVYECCNLLEHITIMSFIPCDIYNQWLKIIEQAQTQNVKPSVSAKRKPAASGKRNKRTTSYLHKTKNSTIKESPTNQSERTKQGINKLEEDKTSTKKSAVKVQNARNMKSAKTKGKPAVLQDKSLAVLAKQLGTKEQNGLALAMLLNVPNTDIVNIANSASELGMLGADENSKIETTTKCLLHWMSLHENSKSRDLKNIKEIENALKELGKSELAALVMERHDSNTELTTDDFDSKR